MKNLCCRGEKKKRICDLYSSERSIWICIIKKTRAGNLWTATTNLDSKTWQRSPEQHQHLDRLGQSGHARREHICSHIHIHNAETTDLKATPSILEHTTRHYVNNLVTRTWAPSLVSGHGIRQLRDLFEPSLCFNKKLHTDIPYSVGDHQHIHLLQEEKHTWNTSELSWKTRSRVPMNWIANWKYCSWKTSDGLKLSSIAEPASVSRLP